jgi:hypothetical protein
LSRRRYHDRQSDYILDCSYVRLFEHCKDFVVIGDATCELRDALQ